MGDICMCEGKECPLKDKCYRYLAKPDTYGQSYFVEPPYKDGKCTHFWEVKPKQSENKDERVL